MTPYETWFFGAFSTCGSIALAALSWFFRNLYTRFVNYEISMQKELDELKESKLRCEQAHQTTALELASLKGYLQACRVPECPFIAKNAHQSYCLPQPAFEHSPS